MWIKKIMLCLISWTVSSNLAAQQGLELVRHHCEDSDPANKCPGNDCRCVDDTLEVTFDGDTASIFEYEAFTPALGITMTLVMDVKAAGRQGWSYGVRHDQSFLTLISAGTASEIQPLFDNGFNQTVLDVQDCGTDPHCRTPVEGGGYVCAVVLSLQFTTELPVGRTALSRAEYTLHADPGSRGTILEISQLLRQRFSPPTEINLSVHNEAHDPRYLVDGWVKAPGAVALFRRGDPNSDGVMNLADAMFILHFLFSGGPEPGCMEAADYDGNEEVQQTDAISMLFWLFLGQRPPLLPGPPPRPCGLNRTPSPLSCDSYTAC